MLKQYVDRVRVRDLKEFGKRHLTKVQQDNFMIPYENDEGDSYNTFLLINYIADHINAIAFEDYSPTIPFHHLMLYEKDFKRMYENAKFYFKTLYDVKLVADFDEHCFHVSFTPDEASNRYDGAWLKTLPPPPSTKLPEL